MSIPDFFNLAVLEISADWDKRTVDIKLGPIKLTAIPWPVAKSLSENPLLIESILSTCFIERRVMWFDGCANREPGPCLDSLTTLSGTLQAEITKVQTSRSRADQLFGRTLLLWNSIVVAAMKRLQDANPEQANEVFNILAVLRVNSYPCVQFLCELLDSNDPIRIEAEELLSQGRRSLEIEYCVPIEELPAPTWQFSSADPIRRPEVR